MRNTTKKRRTRLPQLNCKRPTKSPTSNLTTIHETLDGVFRLVVSEGFDGIPLPRKCTLWQFKRGAYHRVAEGRSKAKLERLARQLNSELDDE